MLWRSWRSRSRRRIENLYTKTAYLVHYHFFQLFLHVFIQEKKTEEDYIFWGLIIKYYSLWDMLLDSNLIDLLLVKMKTFESGIFLQNLIVINDLCLFLVVAWKSTKISWESQGLFTDYNGLFFHVSIQEMSQQITNCTFT